jgi:hypothetical protein
MPAWSFGETDSVVWNCSLYFPIDFNDSASFLLVLGVNRTFLSHEELNSMDSQYPRFWSAKKVARFAS